MSRVRRVGVEYAIRSGIVTRGVHGIGAGFVEGRLYHNSKLPISRGIELEYNQGRIGTCRCSMLSRRTGNLTSRVLNPVILTMLAA